MGNGSVVSTPRASPAIQSTTAGAAQAHRHALRNVKILTTPRHCERPQLPTADAARHDTRRATPTAPRSSALEPRPAQTTSSANHNAVPEEQTTTRCLRSTQPAWNDDSKLRHEYVQCKLSAHNQQPNGQGQGGNLFGATPKGEGGRGPLSRQTRGQESQAEGCAPACACAA